MSFRQTTKFRDQVCNADPVDGASSLPDEAGVWGGGGLRGPRLRYFVYCRKSTEAEERQVQSIESQQDELQRRFTDAAFEIVETFVEAKSAKAPGRPVFNAMMERLERGEADGIMAWAPDRLARNSIDGGRIVYLLDLGAIRDLKFATYTFENNSQGKFMLQIMFGQSKYYSDALSENVKRGNRTKAARGWRPNGAPLGYRNDRETKTIEVDPVYFPLIRRMFDLVLVGGCSSREIARIAREDWGLRTPKRPRSGGTPIATSSLHKMLINPFYAGLFVWEGQVHQGKHVPVVTLEEFRRVQELLRRPTRRRVRKNSFTFSGLIRCGACGAALTAEHKINRYGKRYTYYHCSRRGAVDPCREPSLRAEALEAQVAHFIRNLTMRPDIERWVRHSLTQTVEAAGTTTAAIRQSVAAALQEAQAQVRELLDLRLRQLIDDQEFTARRADLQREALRLAQDLERLDRPGDVFSPFEKLVSFSVEAAKLFAMGDDEAKRLLLRAATTSHPTLKGKILSFEAAKCFQLIDEIDAFTFLRGARDNFTTTRAKRLVNDLTTTLLEPATIDLITQTLAIRGRSPLPDEPDLAAEFG